jgi:hypothetical protein
LCEELLEEKERERQYGDHSSHVHDSSFHSALQQLYFPTPVREIFCLVPSIVSMPVLVPLVVGLKITQRVPAPTSMVCPQSVASMKSVESLPRILMPEIVCTIGVSLVMTMLAGMLSVSTGWTANEITERDKRTLGSVGGETRAKVAALVGASELLQWDGTPKLSNVESKTPSVSFLAVVGERLILGAPRE